MPALRVFRRQFSLASDDVPLPALMGAATRVALTATLCAVAVGVQGVVEDPACQEAQWLDSASGLEVAPAHGLAALRSASLALAGVFSGTLVVFLLLFAHSLRGTIVDAEKRACVAPLLQVVSALLALEVCAAGASLYWVFGVAVPPPCEGHASASAAYFAARFSVVVTFVNAALFALCGCATRSDVRVVYEAPPARSQLDSERAGGSWAQGSESVGALDSSDSFDSFGSVGSGQHEQEGQEQERPLRADETEHASDDEGMSWSVKRLDWERRCRMWCCAFEWLTCGLFGGQASQASDETYRNVANVMARFFKGMDVVPSDAVAALALLRAEQRAMEAAAVESIVSAQRELGASMASPSGAAQQQQLPRRSPPLAGGTRGGAAPSPVGPFESPSSYFKWLWPADHLQGRAYTRLRVQQVQSSHVALDDEARRVLAEAQHYSPLMLGAYGKLLYAYMNLFSAPCSLLCPWLHTGVEAPRGRAASHVVDVRDDDCCSFNHSAMRVHTARRQGIRVVFASFSNKAHQSPYSLAVDSERRVVVLSVRGTLSAVDMLVDAVVTPRALAEQARRWGFGHLVDDGSHAHGGMLQTAVNIREDIEKHQVLHALIFGAEACKDADGSHDLASLPDCRGFPLKLVGHSLGAGVSSILSLLLKPLVPSLTVLAYSPPGCIFDLELAKRSEAWIYSIFVGNDMVPHASWRSLMKLRCQLLECLRRAKVNKPEAMRSAVLNTPASELLYAENEVPSTPARVQLALKIAKLKRQADSAQDFLNRTPMFAPGKLLHLMRTETRAKGCCGREDTFLPVWVLDRRALDEFQVSRRMALDHFPDVCADAIDTVVRSHCEEDWDVYLPSGVALHNV